MGKETVQALGTSGGRRGLLYSADADTHHLGQVTKDNTNRHGSCPQYGLSIHYDEEGASPLRS